MARRLLLLMLLVLSSLDIAFAFRQGKVQPGIDVLRERGFDLLRGKRVGLITNPTGVSSDLQSTIDILASAPGVKLVALFGPEHGVRGDIDAGKTVEAYNDSKTGLPVYSLYGRTRKPTKDMLRDIDVLVYDIQDIGVRSYTYISTMGLAMEAAAENNVAFIVLDRPDPLTGARVEGPMLEPRFKSFIGAYPVPYVYGLTAGELAQMINGEGWLAGGVKCNLTVIQMKGWKRSMWWDQTGLPWVPTSPHLPQSQSTIFYVLTGLLGELGTANQGVGYTLPFELVGGPWVDQYALARYLNSLNLEGVVFRPMTYTPFYKDTTGVRYKGVQVHITDRERLNMTAVQMAILHALVTLFPDNNIFDRARNGSLEAFDRAVGNNDVRRWVMSKMPLDSVIHQLDQLRAVYVVKRERYLLYE